MRRPATNQRAASAPTCSNQSTSGTLDKDRPGPPHQVQSDRAVRSNAHERPKVGHVENLGHDGNTSSPAMKNPMFNSPDRMNRTSAICSATSCTSAGVTGSPPVGSARGASENAHSKPRHYSIASPPYPRERGDFRSNPRAPLQSSSTSPELPHHRTQQARPPEQPAQPRPASVNPFPGILRRHHFDTGAIATGDKLMRPWKVRGAKVISTGCLSNSCAAR